MNKKRLVFETEAFIKKAFSIQFSFALKRLRQKVFEPILNYALG